MGAAFDLMGTCGYCGRAFTANRHTLAKHGYVRQWGQELGQCPGSYRAPLELDKVTLVMLKLDLQATIDRAKDVPERFEELRQELPADRREAAKLDKYSGLSGVFVMDLDKELRARFANLGQLLTFARWAERDLERVVQALATWKRSELTKRPKEKKANPDRCPGSGQYVQGTARYRRCPACTVAYGVSSLGKIRAHKKPKGS